VLHGDSFGDTPVLHQVNSTSILLRHRILRSASLPNRRAEGPNLIPPFVPDLTRRSNSIVLLTHSKGVAACLVL
jgi:hypothetical protein